MWLARHFGLSEGWHAIVVIVWGLFAIYFVFYVPIKLWMSASRRMHIALLACVVLCFVAYEFFRWYSTKPDWTSHGLNPDRVGFQPQVLVLAGEFDFRTRDSSMNLIRSGKAYFEIRMRGHDYYYCRKWHGDDWRPGSWFRVEIANHGEGWSWGLHCSSIGTGGGGGSGYIDRLLAQRLWNGPELVGAREDDLISEERQWPKRKEEFSDLVKVGRWLIPTHIRFSQPENLWREENYYIKKIEFLPTPDTNWFEHVMAKYVDGKSEFRSIDLGEPGIAPEKRK